jgi:hypothetical protein
MAVHVLKSWNGSVCEAVRFVSCTDRVTTHVQFTVTTLELAD